MITILIVCILLFKFKVQLLATTKNDYLVLKIDFLSIINVFYVKILIFDGSIYYKINNRIYKKLKFKKKKQNSIELPRLNVNYLSVYTTLNDEDYVALLGVYGILSNVIKLLPIMLKRNLKIKRYHSVTVPIFDKGENSVQLTAIIGFGLIKFVIELFVNHIKRRFENGNTRLARQNNQ